MLTVGIFGTFSSVNETLSIPTPRWMFHDAAVAVVREGNVMFAMEEERCTRLKHTNRFPEQSLKRAFVALGATPTDVRHYAFPFSERFVDNELLLQYIVHGAAERPSARVLMARSVTTALQVTVDPTQIVFHPHHLCHAMAAWTRSGFDKALICVIDGNGERESITIFKGGEGKLQRLSTYGVEQSLGHYYSRAIQLLGYDLFDEYKVMGLAPYGREGALARVFDNTYELLPNGQYVLAQDVLRQFLDVGFPPRGPNDPILQVHKDFARGLQDVLELLAVHVLKYWMSLTRSSNLCLGGGVAQNSAMAGRIARQSCVGRIFVDPSAHDAGAAIGAALLSSNEPVHVLPHTFLGPDLPPNTGELLDRWRPIVESRHSSDVISEAAQLLSEGSILGWVNGRSEFGARALGHRSILAAPGSADVRDRINQHIKKRETFRPLAPIVLQEASKQFFEIPESMDNVPFMNMVVTVSPEARPLLAAVTHVDGTARVQTVSKDSDPVLHSLLCTFGLTYGVPVLLNTSLNNRHEPIAESVDDAVTCLVTMPLDVLVVGDYIVRRRQSPEWGDFVVTLPMGVALRDELIGGQDVPMDAGRSLCIVDYPRTQTRVSNELFALLRMHLPLPIWRLHTVQLIEEVHALWSLRLLTVRPPSTNASNK
ncbi:hypothetical protein C4K19_4022 [Pseudomonas chlororaphis subsp. aurantiaca]|uniref:carbamoyltransferase family protein n=1 Tax=Pseudomonas chlororaphis TaxID=587753 RepID=UPI000F57825E|nr:carbamoyltransferase C-terminal domain-containing protein [Pseudomonas chlororaphis]AZD55805.1 hypothetical protein C4K19_4022 [Pseudomonas chlororaphis subsp. aurantiaca]